MFNDIQYDIIKKLLREKAALKEDLHDLTNETEALKKEIAALRAALNAPDIDFPNSEKGGQDEPGTPENSPDSDLI